MIKAFLHADFSLNDYNPPKYKYGKNISAEANNQAKNKEVKNC
jgi:hypothetical protein